MIGFLAHHWKFGAIGVGGMALIALVAALVMNPGGVLLLARSVGGFVLDKARGAVEWLRKPHDWWRIGCFSMALLFALASFTAYDQRRKVIVVVRDAASAADSCARQIAEKDASLADFEAQQIAFAKAARDEAARLKQAQDQSAEAQAQVAAAQAAAEKSNRAWWSGYAKRPDSCRAAQEALDVACASVGEF